MAVLELLSVNMNQMVGGDYALMVKYERSLVIMATSLSIKTKSR